MYSSDKKEPREHHAQELYMTPSYHSKDKNTQKAPCEICGKGKVYCHEYDHVQNSGYDCASRIEIPQVVMLELRIGWKQKNKQHQAELRHILDTELMDNLGASILQPNSSQYLKQDRRGKKTINSQEIFAREAVEKYENAFPQRQENSRHLVQSVLSFP